MPIRLAFTLSFDDYFAAQRLHSKRSFWARFTWILGRFLAPVWGIVLVCLGYLIHGPGVPSALLLFVYFCGFFLILYPFSMRRRLKRCYLRTRTGGGDCTLEIGEDGIHIAGENTKSEIKWIAVRSSAENERVFILYLAPAKFIVVPKRSCDAAQIDQVRTVIQSKIQSIAV